MRSRSDSTAERRGEGLLVGLVVTVLLGAAVGLAVGASVTPRYVGERVGTAVGEVGLTVGDAVGDCDGAHVAPCASSDPRHRGTLALPHSQPQASATGAPSAPSASHV